jgi:hypothetical protein
VVAALFGVDLYFCCFVGFCLPKIVFGGCFTAGVVVRCGFGGFMLFWCCDGELRWRGDGAEGADVVMVIEVEMRWWWWGMEAMRWCWVLDLVFCSLGFKECWFFAALVLRSVLWSWLC